MKREREEGWYHVGYARISASWNVLDGYSPFNVPHSHYWVFSRSKLEIKRKNEYNWKEEEGERRGKGEGGKERRNKYHSAVSLIPQVTEPVGVLGLFVSSPGSGKQWFWLRILPPHSNHTIARSCHQQIAFFQLVHEAHGTDECSSWICVTEAAQFSFIFPVPHSDARPDSISRKFEAKGNEFEFTVSGHCHWQI